MLDAYADDIAVRVAHVQPAPPQLDIRPFALPVDADRRSGATTTLTVEAVAVHHEPVREAVAYRVTTPDGVVVVSGDTRVCDEVADLARDADVLVHEACRASALRDVVRGSAFEHIFELPRRHRRPRRARRRRAGVGHLVLTHLIPPPTTPRPRPTFAADVRQRRLRRAAHRRPRSHHRRAAPHPEEAP